MVRLRLCLHSQIVKPSAISKVENAPGEVWSGQIQPAPDTPQQFAIDSVGNINR